MTNSETGAITGHHGVDECKGHPGHMARSGSAIEAAVGERQTALEMSCEYLAHHELKALSY